MKKLSLLFCSILTAFCLCVPTNVKATESKPISTQGAVIQNVVSGTNKCVKIITNNTYITFQIDVRAVITSSKETIQSITSSSVEIKQYDNNGVYASNIVKKSVNKVNENLYTVTFTYDILTKSNGNYLYRDQSSTVTVKVK